MAIGLDIHMYASLKRHKIEKKNLDETEMLHVPYTASYTVNYQNAY